MHHTGMRPTNRAPRPLVAASRPQACAGATLTLLAALLASGCGDSAAPTELAAPAPRAEATGLMAGAAEMSSNLPIGIPQGGYTGRVWPLEQAVDKRETPYATQFVPSAGVATRIPVKVVWLQQGETPMVFAKIDLIYSFEGLLFALEDAITEATGVDVHDRVLLATSHSHAAYGDHSQDAAMYLGGDQFNREVFDRMVGELTDTAVKAYQGMAPAAIGVGFDPSFDPRDVNQIFRDRREENNSLVGVDGEMLGGGYKDPRLTLIRVDKSQGTSSTSDDVPLAALYHFGIHGTIMGGDNFFLSTDAPGGIELKFQEQFTRPVVVMHLQGAAGDQSPAGSQDAWARMETLGEIAAPKIKALWSATTTRTGADIGLDAVTQSVTQDRDRMVVTRDGTVDIRYSAYRDRGRADGVVYNEDGTVASPIDEFNSEYGAALCGSDAPSPGYLWGVDTDAYPYKSCAQVETVMNLLSLPITRWDMSWVTLPLQAAEQTVLSAFRLRNVPVRQGDGSTAVDSLVIGAFPGEPVSLYSDTFRKEVEDQWGASNSIMVGYAQDHEGYLLTVEDWLAGGYEPSINQWGPVQGEYLLEQAVALVGALDGAPLPETVVPDRDWSDILFALDPVVPETTLDAGTVPMSIPDTLYTRSGQIPETAQPQPTIPRVTGIATFVWYGGDPAIDMPNVILEKAGDAGDWAPVAKASGRVLDDSGYEMFVAYTPDPLSGRDRHHLYMVEWQAVQDKPTLDSMAGLALGVYRFRVAGRASRGNLGEYPYEGTAYSVASDPFEVVPSSLLVSAAGGGTSLEITASYPAVEDGWRLLSMTSDFRTPTALCGGGSAPKARVEILDGSGAVVLSRSGVTFSSGGDASVGTVDVSSVPAGTYTLRLTDGFGNQGTTQISL